MQNNKDKINSDNLNGKELLGIKIEVSAVGRTSAPVKGLYGSAELIIGEVSSKQHLSKPLNTSFIAEGFMGSTTFSISQKDIKPGLPININVTTQIPGVMPSIPSAFMGNPNVKARIEFMPPISVETLIDRLTELAPIWLSPEDY